MGREKGKKLVGKRDGRERLNGPKMLFFRNPLGKPETFILTEQSRGIDCSLSTETSACRSTARAQTTG